MSEQNEVYNRDALILAWDANKKVLNEARYLDARDNEQKLRKELVAKEFSGKSTGTNRVQLGNGYALKAVLKLNYKVTKNEAVEPADYSHIQPILAKLPQGTAARLIRWVPELNESVYKELTEEEKKIANEFLLITDTMPTLDLEVPKPKKGA